MGKQVVVVSKKWHEPQIEVSVQEEGIGLVISLDDFLLALAKEMGNPTFLVTNSALLSKLQTSATTVLSGVKEVTVQVI